MDKTMVVRAVQAIVLLLGSIGVQVSDAYQGLIISIVFGLLTILSGYKAWTRRGKNKK